MEIQLENQHRNEKMFQYFRKCDKLYVWHYPILTLECSTITTLLVANYTITFACCDTL